jgi:hypothetical protein
MDFFTKSPVNSMEKSGDIQILPHRIVSVVRQHNYGIPYLVRAAPE